MFPTTSRARPMTKRLQQDPTVVVYRISGAFFFGAAASIGAVLERIGDAHRNLIIDFSAVPFVELDGRKDHRGSGAQGRAARRRRLPHRGFGWGEEGARRTRRAPAAGQEGPSIDRALADIRGKKAVQEVSAVA